MNNSSRHQTPRGERISQWIEMCLFRLGMKAFGRISDISRSLMFHWIVPATGDARGAATGARRGDFEFVRSWIEFLDLIGDIVTYRTPFSTKSQPSKLLVELIGWFLESGGSKQEFWQGTDLVTDFRRSCFSEDELGMSFDLVGWKWLSWMQFCHF